jgi:toxin FitB
LLQPEPAPQVASWVRSRDRAFADQILPVDAMAAEHYATIASARERSGRRISGFDVLIAAICRARGAVLATRNLPDFDGIGIDLMDPWVVARA